MNLKNQRFFLPRRRFCLPGGGGRFRHARVRLRQTWTRSVLVSPGKRGRRRKVDGVLGQRPRTRSTGRDQARPGFEVSGARRTAADPGAAHLADPGDGPPTRSADHGRRR